jgi:activator of HSP90 ATPase
LFASDIVHLRERNQNSIERIAVLEHFARLCSHHSQLQKRICEVHMISIIQRITRRQALAGAAAGVALSVSRLPAFGQQPAAAQQPAMDEKPSTAANAMLTSLHQEIELNAAPEGVFTVLLDSKQFATFTGMPATIDPNPGGAFHTFGGLIEGRNVELVPNQRIVQAWRPTHWDPGVYSVVHFELKAVNSGTALVLDHTGFPEGEFDHLDPGWYQRYWDPLKKYLAARS